MAGEEKRNSNYKETAQTRNGTEKFKPSGLQDNSETAKHMRRSFEAKKKQQRRDNSEAAKDIRKRFQAYGGTTAKLPKTCEDVSKRRKISNEETRDWLKTKQIQNPHFAEGKVKQNHKIFNIPIAILANKTTETH